ncbi:choice-of-anchor D domain-containing protein [Flavobacterium sp.]|uniref:choice-of-anchor D domain-containing protein n=1 Tax=Flavobacterium sp. TaxID=239 RepID=UPI0025FDD5C4|nr:choice-of-anchor D domain-containing protein [Flavobacterium sp.]
MKKLLLKSEKLILIILLLIVTFIGRGQTQTYTTNGTFVTPLGVSSIQAEAYGGGGGGGYGGGANQNGGGGGGGGGYTIFPYTVVPGTSYAITVGTGGSGSTGGNGINGTSTIATFASGTINATGGAFGRSYANGGNGGNGGNGTKNGGTGGSGISTGSGGGGGAAGPTSGGGNGTVTIGGTAGGGFAGTGGNGSSLNAATGTNGNTYGGGGGGGTKTSNGGNGSGGYMIITYTCPTYALTSAPTITGPFCGTSTAVMTLKSNTLTSGTYTVTYNLSGATTAIGNTAVMNFTAGSPGTGTFTTPTLNVGTTTILVTNLSSSYCTSTISSNNSINAFVYSTPTASAGSAITTCSTSGAVNITAGSSATNQSSVTWTSSGSGMFTNANSLTLCTYNPSAADIVSGSVTLTLTAFGNAPCGNVTSSKTVTISNAMTANAGIALSTCSTSGAINITTGSSATNQTSILWTSSGSGTFVNPNSLTTCTYTPSAADITAGSVTITLTVSNAACPNVTASKTMTIYSLPTAVAGSAITTCSTSGAVNITAGSSATNQSSVTWTSSGSGTFTNSNSLTLCTYNPSAFDIVSGSVTLTLTAFGNAPCGNATSTKTVTIKNPMLVVAGSNVTTCSSSGAVNITSGSSATNQTSVTWTTSGTGTFVNPNSLTTCTYTPSAADISSGSVTLTLTASNGGCANVTATKTLTITAASTAVAGTPINSCSTSGAVNITAGSSATNQTSVTWTSSGSGTFTNSNSLTLCTYNPSAADITAGSVTLTLTASGNAPCGNATSSKTLMIINATTAIAGSAITTCATTGAVNITTGSSATNQTSIAWSSSGTGTFANATSLTACTYTPSAADITGGSLTLTLTSFGNAPCGNVTSTKTLTINPQTTAIAGTAITACSSAGSVNITTGSSATNQTSINWTSSGTGTFANATSLTTCTYTPSAADITAGSVTLTLTALNTTCTATSTKTMTIIKAATAVAGTAITTCASAGTLNITAGSSATNQTSIIWSSNGDGTFSNPTSLTTCTYTPGSADITGGSVTLTLTSFANAPCGNVMSSKTLTINAPTTAIAGTAINTCSTSGAVNITAGSGATNQTSVLWSSSGTGSFANANSLTNCTYTPSASDIAAGNVTLTLTAFSALCANDTSTKTVTIYATPIVTATFPGSRTGTGTVILGANSSVGTLLWYAASSGGSNLGFGTSFTTPSISTTTIFYVEAANGTCTSTPRSSVVASVNNATINVTGNASAITNGSVATSTTNWTDFGSANATRTFTINNTGAGILSLGAITFSGANASEFTVTTAPSNSIGPSSSTTFVVTFNPTAAGTRNASISIVNNDTSNNPYVFAIKGTGVVQGITIQGNAATITNGAATTTTANWTDYSTVTNTRTFTITNLGNIVLTIGAITFTGINASEFTIQTPPSSPIAANGITTFTVLFTPTAAGTRNATISIVNNDSTKNPYTFALSGTGTPQLSSVKGNATTITYGSTTPTTANWTDFSNVTVTRTYTIFNSGTIPLSIGAITFTGTNPGDFSVQTAPSSVVPALGSTTFTILFTPGAIGTRTAVLNIANGDTTKNPFYFTIQGTGVTQAITVSGNASSITNGTATTTTANWTDFSTVASTRTFTINNTGNFPLTIGAISFIGANASEFTIQTAPSSSVAAFGSTTFTVLFTPTAAGVRNATIRITNGDSSKNPFSYALSGTGGTLVMTVANPNGVLIADGDVTPTAAKQTDFGTVSIQSGSVTVTYTIKNTGTGTLSIGAATFTGTNSADFSMSAAPSATLAAGATTTFQIDFNPIVKGTKTATFAIVTNATGMNPFNFDITGVGVQTYADTDGDGITDNKDLDDDNDGILDVREQSDAISYPLNNLLTYTFLNETFGAGQTKGKININIPGASTTSCYEDNITTNANSCATNSSGVLDDGEYCVNYIITNTNGVASDPENIHKDLAWTDQRDHTGDLYGRMAIFNSDNTAGTYFYQAVINGILPNTQTTFGFWVMNLMRQGNLGATIKPNITIEFRDVTGATLIASYNTGDIGRCNAADPSDNTCGPTLSNWLNYTTTVNLGNITDFLIKIRNNAPGGGGNDFAMDDIKITQIYVDSDGDGIANIFDLDDENDGIPDIEEAGYKAYSNNTSKMDPGLWVDANGNGVLDAIDAQIAGGTYIIPDTDGDGVPNYLDLDSDNDSFFDIDEAGLSNGDGDINGDGKGDLVDTDRDGILDLNDNFVGFGTTAKSYALDTDSNGIPDYMQLDSNNDGIKDIQTGLYASLDANNDGKIDGSVDVDKDGILDTFDTNTTVIGSPRDLNRKLYLDFDGRNDYAEDSPILGGLPNATIMAWIDINSAFSSGGVVVGQDKFQIKITTVKTLQAMVNGVQLTFATPLTASRWYHVAATYGGGNLTLYLNGKFAASQAVSGNIAADPSKLTLGKNPIANNFYFKGKIDEVRIFNAALTASQVQRMVYQEIQNSASQVRGTIVPKDVSSLPYSNLLRYYRMDTYKDDIVDDLTTSSIDIGTGMKLYNHKVIAVQQAPMPFTTLRTGTFATAIDDPTKDIRGLDATELDYSIIQVKHNITDTANNVDLAMFVDPGVTIKMNNDTKLQNDWYIKLDGKIDLTGKSQFVQTANSDLDVTSAGSLERDQQGQANKFNYNYWSSPVSSINNTTINHGFTVAGVMKDGTDPNNIQNITWTPGINGSPTTPMTLSSYWIFKFQNSTNSYANWSSVGQNGALLAGQGYTMKGCGAATPDQNYTFVGKPNNGTITSTVGPNNLNLCGNPYPSALDADQFINDNSLSIKGTLYIWQHYSSNTSHNTGLYQGGYATYTKTGGTAPVAPAGVSGLGSSSKTPNRFIPVGQGFFVTGTATGGTITFNNGQRLFIKEDDVANSYTMFRSVNPTVANSNPAFNNAPDSFVQEQFAKLRLGYNSTDNFHRQILLGFMNQHATAGYDNGYDAISIETLTNDMYFINGTDKLNINGDGYFNVNNIYPLGVKNATAGNVTFVVDAKENFDANQEIYIYDNVTNTYNSVKSSSYQINLPAGTYDTRFSLRFKNSAALGTTNNEEDQGIAVIHSQSDNMITIKNELQEVTVKSVLLFNLLGQKVTDWTIGNQNQADIKLQVSDLSTGTYIVKVLTDGGAITKKILVKN